MVLGKLLIMKLREKWRGGVRFEVKWPDALGLSLHCTDSDARGTLALLGLDVILTSICFVNRVP